MVGLLKLLCKSACFGCVVFKAGRWFPSIQICTVCGYNDGRNPLNMRGWNCPVPHKLHDRDANAARNRLAEGLRLRAQWLRT
ncbi:MAG: transposase [Youngiibacter sp.]|nr:transposase [Youngiibacter sp.]